MNTVAIIPARMAATRFPGKPMAKIRGVPMIGHCYLRTKMATALNDVYVATCDREIFDYICSIGGKAVMTSDKHERASDRAAEAVRHIETQTGQRVDVVAMIQGDEPLVHPDMINMGVRPFQAEPGLKVVNLMAPINSMERFQDSNEVKVVVDLRGNAMYFSREPIPSLRKFRGSVPMQKQLGMIFFSRDFLLEYSQLTPTPLEKIESVDMNRVLEHGEKIRMISVEFQTIGVDVPGDLSRAEELMAKDALAGKY